MSQENVALVRQSFDAWNEGGPEPAKQFWAEDFEWHDFPGLPDRRVVRGRDAVVAHLTDQLSLLGELKTTIVEVRVRGETVLPRTELTIHGAKAALTFPARSRRYGRSLMAGFSVCGCSRRGRKPSKPPGCGSSQKYSFGRGAAITRSWNRRALEGQPVCPPPAIPARVCGGPFLARGPARLGRAGRSGAGVVEQSEPWSPGRKYGCGQQWQ